jgi:hypothetical protein
VFCSCWGFGRRRPLSRHRRRDRGRRPRIRPSAWCGRKDSRACGETVFEDLGLEMSAATWNLEVALVRWGQRVAQICQQIVRDHGVKLLQKCCLVLKCAWMGAGHYDVRRESRRSCRSWMKNSCTKNPTKTKWEEEINHTTIELLYTYISRLIVQEVVLTRLLDQLSVDATDYYIQRMNGLAEISWT